MGRLWPEPFGKFPFIALDTLCHMANSAGMTLADYIASEQTTASRFAGELGVPVSTITRLLKGERRPGIDLVARIKVATLGKVTADDWCAPVAPRAPQNEGVAA